MLRSGSFVDLSKTKHEEKKGKGKSKQGVVCFDTGVCVQTLVECCLLMSPGYTTCFAIDAARYAAAEEDRNGLL